MQDVPAYVWLQIGAYVATLIIGTVGAVWSFSKITNGFEKGLLKVGGRIDLLNQSVQPYGQEIEEIKGCNADLKQRVATLEAKSESSDRNQVRIEARIDQAISGRN